MPLLPIATILGRAAFVRQKAGYTGADPPYSTHRLIEAAFPDVVVAGADLPRGVIEMAEVSKGRRALWYNRNVPHPTQRVGLAHGLHHFLSDLRTGSGMRECNVGLRTLERVRALPTDGVEVGCDLFGGELLVPFEALDPLVPPGPIPQRGSEREAWNDHVDRIASTFNVPAGFIRWRIYDLLYLRKTHFFVEG